MMMGEKSAQFVRQKFAAYYSSHCPLPSDLQKREFGFGWRDKIDFRHKAFKSEPELAQFFRNEAPFYASYSVAHYSFPDAQPMPKKNYLGADLVFDLDTSYENEKHDHNPVLCEYCLDRVRQDALRLKKEFLEEDFGFSTKEITANFSGQKGYHLHIESAAVQQYSREARRQLLEYVTYKPKMDEMLYKVKETISRSERDGKATITRGPAHGDGGWKGKAYRTARKIISEATEQSLREYGLTKPKITAILENKTEILQKLEEGNWEYFKSLEKLWEKMFEQTTLKGIEADRQVSMDTARLIRLPESIHGSTGFIAKNCDLEKFKPWRDALAFNGKQYAEVAASDDCSFTIGTETFSLRKGQNAGLPEAAAAFIVCKGKATPT